MVPSIRTSILAAAFALAAPDGVPPAAALDAGPVRFAFPIPLAPVDLDGEFPVSAGFMGLTGVISLSVGPDGTLAGTLDFDGDGDVFTVSGSQSFRNGRGGISLLAASEGGAIMVKGKFDGSGFLCKAKATGSATLYAGAFNIDTIGAPPLVALLELDATASAAGVLSGGGIATISGQQAELSVSGKAVKSLSLAAAGEDCAFGAKGPAAVGGGWIVSWKGSARNCRNAGKRFPLAPDPADLLEGAGSPVGPLPAAGAVALPASHGGGTVQGYPGRVVVFVETSLGETAATAAVGVAGGTVLGKIPAVGYYVAGVAPGGEAAFIDAVEAGEGVRFAGPLAAGAYMASGTYDYSAIIDDCHGNHGEAVKKVFQDAGGGYAFCFDDDDGTGKPDTDGTLRHLLRFIENNGSSPSLVNISSSGGDPATWTAFLRIFLGALSALPEETRDQVAVTFCAGNDDLNLTPLLAELRQDPRFAEVLSRNVLIAAAGEDVYAGSNDAPGDPDVLLLQDASGPGGMGTSYAAPRALAILRRLVSEKGLTPGLALVAAKLAALRNADHELVESEALDAADEILERPVLSVRPGTLRFEVLEGDPAPPSRTFTVRNLGLKGKVLGFEVSVLDSWLSVAPGTGTVDGGGRKAVAVTVDPAGLAPGTYEAVLHVFDPVNPTFDENADVAVVLVVEAPPVYSGAFATSMGSHTTFAGCTFGLSLSGTLRLRPRQGAAGAMLGDGDVDGDLGIVVDYNPPYTSCSPYPFAETGTGTIAGTAGNLQITLTNGDTFTMEFSGVLSGDTITGSATWDQRYTADGDYVYKTGTIPSLVLTKEE